MISPNYFASRWNWYRPILSRMEKPSERCRVDVLRLPIRSMGQDAVGFVPYAVDPALKATIAVSVQRLQEYTLRYMVRDEKVSAHKLPAMGPKAHAMVAHLRAQNPHISRNLLHHWCADPAGAMALLGVCEVLWEQGWIQDKSDMAPWVPAINVLLLKLIRKAISSLSDEHIDLTSHVMMVVIGGLYIRALTAFLKRYLDGSVALRRVRLTESMMMPVTPMAFMQYQPDSSLLAEDRHVIGAYGLEPEIVLRLRRMRENWGMQNEEGMLPILARDQLGANLQRRSWARLSLWKLALDSGQGGWMRFVFSARELDQLLAGKAQLSESLKESLQANAGEPIAAWLEARMQGNIPNNGDVAPWLHDELTLTAFRAFEEDVQIEVARRQMESYWHERKDFTGQGADAVPDLGSVLPGMRRAAVNVAASVQGMTRAWQSGEIVLIQPDIKQALHSGKKLAIKHGSMRVEWSAYLNALHHLDATGAEGFLADRFLPAMHGLLSDRRDLFVDGLSASGCLLRGPVLRLAETAVALRGCIHAWAADSDAGIKGELPPLSMCLSIGGEWSYAELKDKHAAMHRIVFSRAVAQAQAGVSCSGAIAGLIEARNRRMALQPVGGVQIEYIQDPDGQRIGLLDNAGIALTGGAMFELSRALADDGVMHDLVLNKAQLQGALPGYRLPMTPLSILQIERYGDNEKPWLLMKVGSVNLAGSDVELYELLDWHVQAVQRLHKHGLLAG
ncbi:MAG: hypothetical protein R8K50_01760 [Mariprofundus sp.]